VPGDAPRKERDFEDEVVDVLTTESGWVLGDASNIDLATGLDTAELTAFVGQTQGDEWNRLVDHFGDADTAQREFHKRVAQQIDERGTVDVLRRGIQGWGRKFKICYFKPAHGITPLLTELYEANRLTVTRQQRYNDRHANTLDFVLWVNGLPVATVELKNTLTGQNVRNAIEQYRTDRDPKDPFLAKRAVVHFAVDPHLVFMTLSEEQGVGTPRPARFEV
jgi:type I restriction enzyme R subunit